MPDYTYEKAANEKGHRFVCGVDEAGRGPLAGPVCAAAVILPDGLYIEGLNDSKKLTEKKREALFPLIKEQAIAYSIAFASVEEIEEYEEEEVVSEKAFVNHLDSFTEDDLKTLLDVCVLRKLNELTGPFEYKVIIVDGSDADKLNQEIGSYADEGYHVKNMTENGSGKMTILFEKPKKREKLDFL